MSGKHSIVENSESYLFIAPSFSIQILEMRIFINSGKLEKIRPSEGEKSLLLLAKIFFEQFQNSWTCQDSLNLKGKELQLLGSDKCPVKHEELSYHAKAWFQNGSLGALQTFLPSVSLLPILGLALKQHQRAGPPFYSWRGSTKAESREEMDADLPSTRLVSQPQVKPHLPDPSGWHIPPGSPSCHCASVPPAASSLQLCQCTCPSASKGHHSREHGGSRALAHGGSQTPPGSPESLCVGS